MNKKELSFECEKTIVFLCKYMINDNRKKPSLFHSIRVGTYLFDHNYERDIVIAGFLHDIIEDGVNVSEEEMTLIFGDAVLQIVKANSKNKSIEDGQKKKEDLIDRCVQAGESALIVKASDIMDNFFYYDMIKNTDEISHHCMPLAELLLVNKPENFADAIFDRLKDVMQMNGKCS